MKKLFTLLALFSVLTLSYGQTTPCSAVSTVDCASGNYIAKVKLEGIDNTSGCSTYTNYTALSAILRKEETYTIEITPGNDGEGLPPSNSEFSSIAIWIDYNNDGDFDDADERVGSSDPFFEVSSIEFTIPTTALNGNLIMRVRHAYEAGEPGTPFDAPIKPCSPTTFSTGEAEDYVVNILPPDPRPNPDFEADILSTVGETLISFTDLSTNNPTNWTWNITPASGWTFESPSTMNSQNPKVNFTTPGLYVVELIAENLEGFRTETKTDYIEIISPLPLADFRADATTSPSGADVNFTDLSTNTPVSWSWTVTPSTGWAFAGGTDATSADPTINFVNEGLYTIELTATNSFGSDAETKVDYINVGEPLPTIEIEADTTCIIIGDSVFFTTMTTNNVTFFRSSVTAGATSGGFEYLEGTNSNSINPIIKFTKIGTYSVEFTAQNGSGNIKKKIDIVVNLDFPNADFQLGFGPTTVDPGAETYFSRIPGGFDPGLLTHNWEITPATGWEFIAGSTSSDTGPRFRLNEPGKYSVTYTQGNCLGTDQQTKVDFITVNAVAIPVADFIADETIVPSGNTVSFTDLSTQLPASWEWTITPATGWTFTGGTDAMSENPQIEFTDLGLYTVALKATNSFGDDLATKTDYIEVIAQVVVPETDFEANNTDIFVDGVVNFTDLSTNAPNSWMWTISPATGWLFSGGTVASNQNPTVSFTEAGVYSITLDATNGAGTNSETKTDYITVTSNIGVKENTLNISIYPNPFNAGLTVNLTGVEENVNSIEVIDISGRTIALIQNPSAITQLDLIDQATGIYFINVNTGKTSVTKKVTKF